MFHFIKRKILIKYQIEILYIPSRQEKYYISFKSDEKFISLAFNDQREQRTKLKFGLFI